MTNTARASKHALRRGHLVKAQPIADDELESLFSAFSTYSRVLLAVSGGADSTALLVLAARWRAQRAHGPGLIAATIDHGLRRGSRAEARQVAALATRLGVAHETLAWKGAKPATGIEAAAREARYRLLAACAKRHKADALATAHTLDDQAETVLMRLAAGSGPAGLAGMRPRDWRDGRELIRPFLNVRKHRLVATLERDGVAWIEDAMNRDEKFARPRLRAAAAVLAREGLTPERLGRLAMRMARWEDVVLYCAEVALDVEVYRHEKQPAKFDGGVLIAGPEEIAIQLLTLEIRRVGAELKGPHAPRLEQVEALWDELRLAIRAGKPMRRTLGGALIAVAADGALAVTRAPPRKAQRTSTSSQKPKR